MQQETPQVGSAPTLPSPQNTQGQSFYNPSAPAPYVPPHNDQHFQPAEQPVDSFSWEASEYVHNSKGTGWLVGFLIVSAIIIGAAYWFISWTFAAMLLVAAAAMGVLAFRPPRTIQYILDADGVEIAGKLYPYDSFRAFGVLEDGAFFTMSFIPVKRFAPALSVYFAEDDGEKIVDIVSQHLPMEDLHTDFIDTIMRRLRF